MALFHMGINDDDAQGMILIVIKEDGEVDVRGVPEGVDFIIANSAEATGNQECPHDAEIVHCPCVEDGHCTIEDCPAQFGE